MSKQKKKQKGAKRFSEPLGVSHWTAEQLAEHRELEMLRSVPRWNRPSRHKCRPNKEEIESLSERHEERWRKLEQARKAAS